MAGRSASRQIWALALIAVVGIGSCTIAFDLSSLQEGCATNQKLCDDGRCVAIDDPTTGCGDPNSCKPCGFPGGVATCGADERCALKGCADPWDDCDHDASTGCETNIKNDPAHCLQCGTPACSSALPNVAESACLGNHDAGDTCGIAQCVPRFGDCNRDPKDGCEVDLFSDNANCGECDAGCGDAGACVQGHCPNDAGVATPDAA